MLFWVIAIALSLIVVVFIAAPILADVKASGDDKPRFSILRIASLFALGLSPIGALALYFNVGAPESLDPNFHERLRVQQQNPAEAIAALPPEERAAAIEAMVEGLAMRLEAEPDNPDGWRMLARSYAAMGRTADSAAAWREVINRSEPAAPQDWRDYAGVLIETSRPGEPFGEEVMTALNKLIEFNADDPLALFYLAVAAREQGEAQQALEYLQRLQKVVPENAPILPQLENLIQETAAEAAVAKPE